MIYGGQWKGPRLPSEHGDSAWRAWCFNARTGKLAAEVFFVRVVPAVLFAEDPDEGVVPSLAEEPRLAMRRRALW